MTVASARILLVEDSPTQAELSRAFLRDLGHDMRLAATAGEGVAAALDWRPDAVLLDLELPDGSGFDVMVRLKAEGFEAPIIVITANSSINVAVRAMREGAADFLVKPFAKARLGTTLSNVLERRALVSELQDARARLSPHRFHGFIGGSPTMQAAYRTIEAVASSRASVFVSGESGTGKELAAEAVHRASPRRDKPFVAINCGAIPRDLLESEIFGHVKGAFTGATENRQGAARAANGGTLFLDEIGEMPLEMQVKLLRFIQTGSVTPVGASRAEKVDVRFVCATNRDPLAEVEAGRFREDLYYRLHVVPVELPPLRERGQDVLLIARHFLDAFGREEGKRFSGFAPEAEAAMMAYRWPGNVRQLQNVIRNIAVLQDGGLVTRDMLPDLPAARPAEAGRALPPAPAGAPEASAGPAPAAGAADDQEAPILPLAEMERRYIEAVIARCNGNTQMAARLLGISPSTIYRKREAWKA